MNSFKSFEQSDIRTERIFNLFLFVENGVITTYGAKLKRCVRAYSALNTQCVYAT